MKGYFFNAVKTTDIASYPSGYDREYDADDHAAFFAPFFSEAGVFAGEDSTACKVQVQNGNTLVVSAGAVYIRGRMALLDGTDTITVAGDCKVVVRMNKAMDARDFRLVAVTALTRTEDICDLELATVAVRAVIGGYEVQVTDTRTFLSYIGQPPYYPPDTDSLPYLLWVYTMGFPMTAEQRATVEGNPSLMEIYNGTRVVKMTNMVQGNLNTHTANRANPHGVTAQQVGAMTQGDKASTPEAQAGGNDSKWMSPLKVAQAVANWWEGKRAPWVANRLVLADGARNLATMGQAHVNGAMLTQNAAGAPFWSAFPGMKYVRLASRQLSFIGGQSLQQYFPAVTNYGGPAVLLIHVVGQLEVRVPQYSSHTGLVVGLMGNSGSQWDRSFAAGVARDYTVPIDIWMSLCLIRDIGFFIPSGNTTDFSYDSPGHSWSISTPNIGLVAFSQNPNFPVTASKTFSLTHEIYEGKYPV